MTRRIAAVVGAWLLLASWAAAQTPDNWNPNCPRCRKQQSAASYERFTLFGKQPAPCTSCDAPFAERKPTLGEKLDRKSCSYGKGLGDMGCTSWRQTCIFVFGSCWDFYEEPCRRVPRR